MTFSPENLQIVCLTIDMADSFCIIIYYLTWTDKAKLLDKVWILCFINGDKFEGHLKNDKLSCKNVLTKSSKLGSFLVFP